MGVLFSATDESLEEQVAAAQALPHDNTAAMAVVLKRFEGKSRSIARSLTNDWSRRDDAAQGARIGLVKAVRKHKLGRSGFPSYAEYYMRGEARRALAATWTREAYVDPADYETLISPSATHTLNTTAEVTDLIVGLQPQQQAIVKAIYISDAGLGDIASALGISKPAVSQRLSTIYRNLRPVAVLAVAA